MSGMKPFSEDLRARIVAAVKGGMSKSEAARLFDVSFSSVKRYARLAARDVPPDWAVVDGTTAVLIECKATRFTRRALSTGDEGAVKDGLKQVIKGLKQLDEFVKACRARRSGLERFHSCTSFKFILTTLEPLHLINSTFFRKHVDSLLATQGITDLPWLILSVDELEILQTHLSAGISLSGTVDKLRDATFNEVLEQMIEQTGRTYKDSFLYSKEEELYRLLGIDK
jgi:hypothetical protein